MSHDKEPGTIVNVYGKSRPWPGRTKGIELGHEEVPSRHDFENACHNQDKAGWKVDSLTCARRANGASLAAGERPPYPTEAMLQELLGLEFREWHFGHFHLKKSMGRFVCHYGQMQKLGGLTQSCERDDALKKPRDRHRLRGRERISPGAVMLDYFNKLGIASNYTSLGIVFIFYMYSILMGLSNICPSFLLNLCKYMVDSEFALIQGMSGFINWWIGYNC